VACPAYNTDNPADGGSLQALFRVVGFADEGCFFLPPWSTVALAAGCRFRKLRTVLRQEESRGVGISFDTQWAVLPVGGRVPAFAPLF